MAIFFNKTHGESSSCALRKCIAQTRMIMETLESLLIFRRLKIVPSNHSHESKENILTTVVLSSLDNAELGDPIYLQACKEDKRRRVVRLMDLRLNAHLIDGTKRTALTMREYEYHLLRASSLFVYFYEDFFLFLRLSIRLFIILCLYVRYLRLSMIILADNTNL